MTTRQTPDAVREAVARETLAKQYDASMPSRAAHIRAGTSDHKAIDAILAFAALDSRAGDAFDMPEYAPDDISHLEGLACYLDGVARDKGRAGLPASASLFEEIAKRLREYDVIRNRSRADDAVPVAWVFELATCIREDGTYSGWDESPRLSMTKPCVPEGSIRNLRPLYVATPAPAVDAVPAGEVERLREALAAEAKDWRHNACSRVTFAHMYDRLSAALSHGEGRK